MTDRYAEQANGMPIAQRTGEQAPFSAGWETLGNRSDSPNHKKNQKTL
jgi:hypothetical protein